MLRGESGTAYIGTTRIGTITTWEHKVVADAAGVPRGIHLICQGRFATAWRRIGATRAVVRTAPRNRAQKPITFTGDIQTLTAKQLVLANVQQER